MRLHRRIVIYVAIATGLVSAARAAEPDWSDCVVPAFGADKGKALAACEAILARSDISDADRERVLITGGRAAHMANDLPKAIRYFEEAIKLAPNSPEPLVRRASAAYGTGDYETAAAFAQRALRLDANYAPAFDIIGTIGLATKNFRLAKAAYDKEIELAPDDVWARFHHFEYLMDIHAQPEALQDVEKLLALPAHDLDTQFTKFRGREISYHTFARLERATMLQSMGRLQEALQAFDDFVQVDPGAFSYGWRGWYYIDNNEFDLAKADLDRAVSYAPDFWILHNLQGLVYLHIKQHERAVDAYTRSLELGPDRPGQCYWMRAVALRALSRVDEAEVDALKAVSIDNGFRNWKLGKLAQLGYFVPGDDPAKFESAVHDAVKACILDERCS
jgi:tetratricopeptide (TPR) repeat protein